MLSVLIRIFSTSVFFYFYLSSCFLRSSFIDWILSRVFFFGLYFLLISVSGFSILVFLNVPPGFLPKFIIIFGVFLGHRLYVR